MRNPFTNQQYINHIKLIGVLFVIIFNCLVAYGLMWNPYSLYFNRPELSNIYFEKRNMYASIATNLNFLILLGLTILMIIKFWKYKQIFWITPIFGGLTLGLILHIQNYYPDANSSYTKNGYHYLEQSWYLDGEDVFKRFKSDKPINTYSDERTIVWHLDSISIK